MPVSDIKRLYWYVGTLKLSGIVEWGCQPPTRQRQLFQKCYIMEYQCDKTRAVSYRPYSSTFLLKSIVSDMQFTSISQLPIHHHHFSCSASNPVSFRVRNQTVVKLRTQLDAESLGKYPTNRYIVVLIYSGINQFKNHGAVYFPEVSPWPRIMRLHR